MTISRNAREYLERNGLTSLRPATRPRLAVRDLLVHAVPLAAPAPLQTALLGYEGVVDDTQLPDRGAARPWPNQGDAT